MRAGLRAESADSSPQEGLSALEDREVEMIEAALAESHGRISGPSGAAAKLGIPRQTLESKIRRLGIDKYGRSVHLQIALHPLHLAYRCGICILSMRR